MASQEDEADRKMNDSTMPPPPRGAPTTDTKKATSKLPPRKKTGRFGLAEWNRLLANSKDLAQLQGKPLRMIRLSEIEQHDSEFDGWIAVRGKVYNISPYLQYHPGGARILKGQLGTDVTELYDKYHRWVNEDGLIGKLLIGYLDTSRSDDDSSDQDESSYLPSIMSRHK